MRNLRDYARQTNRRLVAGFVALAFVAGGGLIYLFYGWPAAGFGLACMAAGLAPLLLIWLALELIALAARKANER
jgi:hypothetical protein